jgi:hypothetical protein
MEEVKFHRDLSILDWREMGQQEGSERNGFSNEDNGVPKFRFRFQLEGEVGVLTSFSV